jgi:hypothetical protein
MSDGAIRHASPHPPVERSDKCGGCRLQRELDQLRSGLSAERLAAAMNDAQITAEEIRLGHDLTIPARRIMKALEQ